jgi:hypothetical protein
MASASNGAKVAVWHRWLGLAFSIPLLGWVVSSVALVVTTFDIPNGLQGVFSLQPYNSVDLPLDSARLRPAELLRRIQVEHGLARIHWMRLESRGSRLWYVIRPTPFSATMTFDAVTGERLDPLPDSMVIELANEALVGTRVESVESVGEFNRDYSADRIPAVAARMSGDQPSVLILSRDNGRTLRRMDADAEGFEWWYKTFHVNQYSDHVIPWTVLLYLCAVGVIAVSLLGYVMFWTRRRGLAQNKSVGPATLSARNLHRKAGVLVGGVLVVQIVAGTYIWLSLGPLNPAFRGKPSFNPDWDTGIPVGHALAEPAVVLAATASLARNGKPVQAIEWRRIGDIDAWLVSPRRDEPPLAFDARSGKPMGPLPPEVAGSLARDETIGRPDFEYLGPVHFASMDLNQRLPAYRFRFRDPASTDIFVLQNTGEVVMRRPEFWRVFGPFLATHMLSVSKNKVVDILVLGVFQLGFLLVIITGWRLQFPGKTTPTRRPAKSDGEKSESAMSASVERGRQERHFASASRDHDFDQAKG